MSVGTDQSISSEASIRRKNLRVGFVACGKYALLAAIPAIWFMTTPTETGNDAKISLLIFAGAVWLWVFAEVSDTLVALGAACLLVVVGVIDAEALFAPLGHETIWLLIGAFVVASAVSSTGLAVCAATRLCDGITSPRVLIHLLTLSVVCTAFAIPATSGRAALALPVFLAVAEVVPTWLRRVLAVTLPGVVLFSAVASLIGAGAHLITGQILESSGLDSFSFTEWLLLGLPFALVSSHLSAEITTMCLSTPTQRRERLTLSFPEREPLSRSQRRSLLILGTVCALWFTEGLHDIPPAVVAVLGAVLVASPVLGTVNLGQAVKDIPWSLLIFMASTVTISQALTESGAVEILTHRVFEGLDATGFIIMVITVSTCAHFFIQSRSARSAVLVPLVIALAPATGVNAMAAAFISTAAAGYCHTLPASAKPLTIFRGDDTETQPRFTTRDLLWTSVFLMPMHVCVTVIFSFTVWPALGLTVFA